MLSGEVFAANEAFPSDVVAFSYASGWTQIPVQIDERDVVEYARIYGAYSIGNPNTASFGANVSGEVYCDPFTFTGADTDQTVDANDEIVLLASDAGERAMSAGAPEGVVAATGIEITLRDSLNGQQAYIYLFLHDGSLDSAAGISYVDYNFHLLSGDYLATYNTAGNDALTGLRNDDHGEPLNAEDSTIRTSTYQRHWSYRWTCDQLSLLDGPNLIEREDYWIAPGACSRHVGTFNAQEGCFIANVTGPIRAIRSFLGANSGPLVQVDRLYYQAREDIAVFLRVHPRAAVGMFYVDHTLEALGMTYSNNMNSVGVPIDGKPDDLVLGPVDWELVTGDQGSMIRIHDIDTDIRFSDSDFTLFFADQFDPDVRLCESCLEGCQQVVLLGDSNLIGASGVWNTASLPNTDPALLATNYLTILVTTYYSGTGWTTMDAEIRSAWHNHPLEIDTAPWPNSQSDP